jgi:hypothetical protein
MARLFAWRVGATSKKPRAGTLKPLGTALMPLGTALVPRLILRYSSFSGLFSELIILIIEPRLILRYSSIGVRTARASDAS